MSELTGSISIFLTGTEGHEHELGAYNKYFVEVFDYIWREDNTSGMSWMLGEDDETRGKCEKGLYAGTITSFIEDDISNAASYCLVQKYVEGLAREIPEIGSCSLAYLSDDDFKVSEVCTSNEGSCECVYSEWINKESFLSYYSAIIEESAEVSELFSRGRGFFMWEEKYDGKNLVGDKAKVARTPLSSANKALNDFKKKSGKK